METPVLTIRPPLLAEDLPGLFLRLCTALDTLGDEVICEVGGVAADAVALHALARLQLAARRRGCRIRLHGAPPELLALIALTGLERVLPAV
jgi:ABC-type transporter Mla MlaB component